MRQHAALVAFVALLATGLLACTGGRGGGGGTPSANESPTTDQVVEACRAICETAVTCEPERVEDRDCDSPGNECLSFGWEFRTAAHLNAVRSTCGRSTPSCPNFNVCLEQATATLPVTTEYEACERLRTQRCSSIGNGCEEVRTYNSFARSLASDCLELDSCDDVSACLESIIDD